MTVLDEVSAAWPPPDPPEREGYTAVPLTGTLPLAALPLGSDHAVVVAATAGDELHCVPVTRAGSGWRRAVAGDGVAAALVGNLDGGPVGDFELAPGRDPVVAGPAVERAVTGDQTNESVIVGDRSVVKWIRRPPRGAQPALLLAGHLDEVGYRGTPQVHGFLTWRGVLLAGVDAYLPGARDGWEWCVDLALDRIGGADENYEAVDAAGALLAGLHRALATPSSVILQPCGTAAVDGWHEQARATLDRAVKLVGERWLTRRRGQLGRVLDAEYARVADVRVAVQPIHGDLHVGQLLRWDRGLAVIDFEGNPTPGVAGVGEPQSPGRDLAQLWCSIGHAGYVADKRTDGRRRRTVEHWIGESQFAMLDAYRWGIGDAGDERLDLAFIVEQQCRELVYAATRLPRWAYAPEAGLRSLFPKEDRARRAP